MDIKQIRKDNAEIHTADVAVRYRSQIIESVKSSAVYRNISYKTSKDGFIPTVELEQCTTQESIFKSDPRTAVLNFASFKFPGGGFIKGSMAQEEALCHSSFLYNVISDKRFAKEYEWNRSNLNNSLYSNFAIYSPDIIFEDEHQNPYWTDVITCAAPNLSAYNGDCNTAVEVMKDRIKFIFNVADTNNINTLILGAFGCGVFKNNPHKVAEMMMDELSTGLYRIQHIVFAIPAGPNYDAFKKVIDNYDN